MKINTILGIAATIFATTLVTTTLTAQAYDVNAYNMGAKSDTDNMVPYASEMRFAPYYWNYSTSDNRRTEVTNYRRMVPVVAGGRTITNVEVDDSFNGQYIYTSWRYYQERTGQTSYPTNAIWVNTPNGYGFYVATTNSYSPTTTQSVVIYIVSSEKQSYDPNGKMVINLSDRNKNHNYSHNSWNNNLNDYYQSYNNYNRCRTVTAQDEWKQTSLNVWTRVPGVTTTKCDDNSNSNNWNWYNNSYNNSSSWNSYNYSTPTWSIPSNYNSYYNYNNYNNGYYYPNVIERPSEPTLRINYNTDNRAGKLVWNNPGSVQADEWKIFENGIQIAASRISGSNQSGEYNLSETRIGSEYRVELCKNDFCTTSKAVVSSGRY